MILYTKCIKLIINFGALVLMVVDNPCKTFWRRKPKLTLLIYAVVLMLVPENIPFFSMASNTDGVRARNTSIVLLLITSGPVVYV